MVRPQVSHNLQEEEEHPSFMIHDDDFSGLLPAQPNPPFDISRTGDDGIRTVPLPGVRCPTCAKEGKEVWVIPGRACGYCGTPCL